MSWPTRLLALREAVAARVKFRGGRRVVVQRRLLLVPSSAARNRRHFRCWRARTCAPLGRWACSGVARPQLQTRLSRFAAPWPLYLSFAFRLPHALLKGWATCHRLHTDPWCSCIAGCDRGSADTMAQYVLCPFFRIASAGAEGIDSHALVFAFGIGGIRERQTRGLNQLLPEVPLISEADAVERVRCWRCAFASARSARSSYIHGRCSQQRALWRGDAALGSRARGPCAAVAPPRCVSVRLENRKWLRDGRWLTSHDACMREWMCHFGSSSDELHTGAKCTATGSRRRTRRRSSSSAPASCICKLIVEPYQRGSGPIGALPTRTWMRCPNAYRGADQTPIDALPKLIYRGDHQTLVVLQSSAPCWYNM